MSGRWGNEAQDESIGHNHWKEVLHFFCELVDLLDAFKQIYVFSENDSVILRLSTMLGMIDSIFLYFLWISGWCLLLLLFCEMKVFLFFVLDILEKKNPKDNTDPSQKCKYNKVLGIAHEAQSESCDTRSEENVAEYNAIH